MVGLLALKNGSFNYFLISPGPFNRPHPAVWRVVLAISIFYWLCFVFMLFQSKESVRRMLHSIDPSIGTASLFLTCAGLPLEEKNYALEDCSLSTITDKMDIFVLAHTIGWFCKALVLRDYWFCWILSVMFELMVYLL